MKRLVISLTAATITVAILASAAHASCVPITAAQQRARAHVIFDGVALENPTATGVQRFRVTRYRKGTGPRVVRVSTGHIRRADGTGTITSASLDVRRGERWRIFGRGSAQKVLLTSACSGSRRL
jgi:hypothetical protein